MVSHGRGAVSYTHLDVYKRQQLLSGADAVYKGVNFLLEHILHLVVRVDLIENAVLGSINREFTAILLSLIHI